MFYVFIDFFTESVKTEFENVKKIPSQRIKDLVCGFQPLPHLINRLQVSAHRSENYKILHGKHERPENQQISIVYIYIAIIKEKIDEKSMKLTSQ